MGTETKKETNKETDNKETVAKTEADKKTDIWKAVIRGEEGRQKQKARSWKIDVKIQSENRGRAFRK